jgi:hypothetical protein
MLVGRRFGEGTVSEKIVVIVGSGVAELRQWFNCLPTWDLEKMYVYFGERYSTTIILVKQTEALWWMG